ncbi:MAG: hypothetical protein FWD57_12960 [Polyangiaceae bacterium]|nr:hypothetical protein [Polyangiaceae bacterium]
MNRKDGCAFRLTVLRRRATEAPCARLSAVSICLLRTRVKDVAGQFMQLDNFATA